MKVIRRCEIIKSAFTKGFDGHGVFQYSAQVNTSIDGGITFWHCGDGRYCKTLEEAEQYKAKIEQEG